MKNVDLRTRAVAVVLACVAVSVGYVGVWVVMGSPPDIVGILTDVPNPSAHSIVATETLIDSMAWLFATTVATLFIAAVYAVAARHRSTANTGGNE